jgi:hypothetical protein
MARQEVTKSVRNERSENKSAIVFNYKAAFLTFLAALFGTAATLLAALFTGYAGWWKDSKDVDLKMIETALAILSSEKGGPNIPPARRFAILTLQQHSGIKMEQKYWDEWMVSPNLLLPPRPPSPRTRTKEEMEDFTHRETAIASVFGDWKLATKEECIVKFLPATFLELDHVVVTPECKGTQFEKAAQFDLIKNKTNVSSQLMIYSADGKELIHLYEKESGVISAIDSNNNSHDLKKVTN